MYKEILKYQDLDMQLDTLDKQSKNNPLKVQLRKLADKIIEDRKKLIEVDNIAGKELKDFDKLKNEFNTISTEIENLNAKAKIMQEDELEKAIAKISSYCNRLSTMQRLLSMQQKEISELLNKSATLKKAIYVSMTRHREFKEKDENNDKILLDKENLIKKQMLAMEKDVDKRILAKYKELKQDMELPIFLVSDNSEWCPCGMHIPAALNTKLKEQGYLICEQCRKYILYKE